MKPASERQHSDEHGQALEAFDLAERKLARHQRDTDCRPPLHGFKAPGRNYNEGRHWADADHLADHIALVEARDAARLAVAAADPKLRQSSLADA